MKRDFHVYFTSDAGGTCLTVVIDPNDVQKADLLKAMAKVLNSAGRSREADECLHAINWKAD